MTRLPVTKGDLFAALEHLADDALVGVAGQHGEPVAMEIDFGFIVPLNGAAVARNYAMFSPVLDDEDEDD
jgi:hypothetical protein